MSRLATRPLSLRSARPRRRRLSPRVASSTALLFTTSVFIGLSARPAHAILNGVNVPDTFFGQVGHVFDAGGGRGTGTIIKSSVLKATGSISFVLTAAHNNGVSFRPLGATGVLTARNLTHDFRTAAPVGGLAEDDDIALMQFNTPFATIPPSYLFRGAFNRGLLPVVGNSYQMVAYDGTLAGTQKKTGVFTISATSVNNLKAESDQPPPPGAAVSQPGDSGAPYYQATTAGNSVAAVHNSGDGVSVSISTVLRNFTPGHRYLDWIDSYTERSVYWDNLRIGGVLVDGFEAAAAGSGLANGWTDVAVNHPLLGAVGLSGNWTDNEVLGASNATTGGLFTQGARSQGNWVDTGETGYANVISKTFTVSSAANLDIDQRWNSMLLYEDIGIQLGNGAITWLGLTGSQAGDLDVWIPRTIPVPAGQVTVYLLSAAAAPEPGSLALLTLVGGTVFGRVALRRRRRA